METGSTPPPERPTATASAGAGQARAGQPTRAPGKRPSTPGPSRTDDPRDETGPIGKSRAPRTGADGARTTAKTRSAGGAAARMPKSRVVQGVPVVDPLISTPDAPPTTGPVLLPAIMPAEIEPAESVRPQVLAPLPPMTPPPAPVALEAPPTSVVIMPTEGLVPVGLGADGADTIAQPSLRRSPMTFQRRRRPRVRRVTRVVRHVDTWSVFKVAAVFNAFFYLVCLTAGVLLWQVAYATGTVDNIEKFFEGFGWSSFDFKGGEIFHNAWIAGLFVAVGLTGLAVFLATLFNLITDLVGGIRVSVLEEEVVPRSERSLLMRFGRPAPNDAAAYTINDDAITGAPPVGS